MASTHATRYERFINWQYVLAGLHLAGAAAVTTIVAAGDDWKIPVHMTFNVWERQGGSNECSERAPCVLTENRAVLPRRLSLGAAVSTFSLFSGGHHLFIATHPEFSKRMIDRGVNVVRWIDYAWAASLMLAVNSVLWVAPPDLQGLVNWFSVQFLVILVGYGSEVAWAAGNWRHAASLFGGACLAYAAVWGTAWATFVVSIEGHADTVRLFPSLNGTATDVKTNSPPDLVYALLVWLCGSFLLFPIVHAAKISTNKDTSDMLLYEVWYSFLSLFSKIPLLVVFASGVIGRSDRTTLSALPANYTPPDSDETSSTTLVSLGSAAAGCILIGLGLAVDLILLPEAGIFGPWTMPRRRSPRGNYERILLMNLHLYSHR